MGWRVTKSENPNVEFDVYWNDIGIDSEKLQSLKPYQKVNHFPSMFQITRKTFLAKNLKRLQKLYPLEFNFFPKTWVLPNELNELRTYASQRSKKSKTNSSKKTGAPESKSGESQLLIQTTNVTEATTPTPTIALTRETTIRLNSRDEIAKNGFIKLPKQKTTIAKDVGTEESEESECGDDDEKASQEDSGGDSDQQPEQNQREHRQPISPVSHVKAEAPIKWKPPKDQRKAPLVCNVNKKTRFPMIVKPDCSSQGKGIFITCDIDSIPKDEVFVVQQYLHNPYLIDGLKFDLRLYVLIISCEPLKIFLYEEGLVRFATSKFVPLDANSDRQAFNNYFMHLTNYAINKESEHFKAATSVNDDKGHKRTLTKVLERLKAEGQDTDRIMGEIKDVIIKTLITIQQELAHNYRTCQPADLESLMCFEILGFDIILDDTGKPILLEVNQAPSFATDSPLDYEIKKGVFVDMFRLLGLSVEKKKQKVKRLFEEKKDRMLTKLTLKQKNQLRKQAISEFKKEQDVFEAENSGRFEKIYPLPVREACEGNVKTQENSTLSSAQKQLAQSQYQALLRQQERYNQLLATLSNTDIEKAIRAKNRHEETSKREEKIGVTKLRLKQKERKRLDHQIVNSRALSHLKKPVLQTSDPTATIADYPPHFEGQNEEKQRQSVVKSPNNLELQVQMVDLDQKLIQSLGDRISDNMLAMSALKARESDKLTKIVTPSFALKQAPPHAQFQGRQHRASVGETMSTFNYDQNFNLKQLIEIQQKIAASGGGAKTTTFNIVNFVMTPTKAQSLTGRTSSNNKQLAMSDLIQPQVIDGLKPNITQLAYQSNLSTQSQNPLCLQPQKLKANDLDAMTIGRTTGHSNRQSNLLPNIPRNMIPTEKSSSGFQSAQVNGQPSLIQQNEYITNNPKHHRQRFRGSQEIQTPGQVALLNGQQQNSSLHSPKRTATLVERSQFLRSSIQQSTQQKPLAMKTQQMNLAVMNVQPVIIDSNHFNQVEMQPKSPSINIPLGGGNSYKTQKFSKIQLQTIIDNLYQYEPKGAKGGKDSSKGVSSPHDLSKTTNFKPFALQQMQLPEVNTSERIQAQSSGIANLALNAISVTRAVPANAASAMTESEGRSTLVPSSPRRISSQGPKVASSESKKQSNEELGGSDPSRTVTHRSKVSSREPGVDLGVAPKKLAVNPMPIKPQGGSFVVHGSSFQISDSKQPIKDANAETASKQGVGNGASAPSGSVINFNNCNVTIINNNFDSTPSGQFGATIIQSSLNTRSLNGKSVKKTSGIQ